MRLLGATFRKARRELLVLGNVDRVHGVGQADFLEHDGSLAAVRRGPGVEVDHVRGPCMGMEQGEQEGRVARYLTTLSDHLTTLSYQEATMKLNVLTLALTATALGSLGAAAQTTIIEERRAPVVIERRVAPPPIVVETPAPRLRPKAACRSWVARRTRRRVRNRLARASNARPRQSRTIPFWARTASPREAATKIFQAKCVGSA